MKNQETEASRLSFLARRIVGDPANPHAEEWDETLDREISGHLSRGRDDVLRQAVALTVEAFDRAPSDEDRTEASLATEYLMDGIDYRATTHEIPLPRTNGEGKKIAFAHIFAIPVFLFRDESVDPQEYAKIETTVSGIEKGEILALVEQSLLNAISAPQEHRATLRILDYAYTAKQIEKMSWSEARRLTLRALCHFSGTDVSAAELHQASEQPPLQENVEVRYLIGVYCCDEADPVFHQDEDCAYRLEEWSDKAGLSIAAYMIQRQVGSFRRAGIGSPMALFMAERLGRGALLHEKFNDELGRLEPHLGKDPCALVEAIENGHDGVDICVKLFSEPASNPSWDYVGQAVRRTLGYEDTALVLDQLIGDLHEIGIARVQVVKAPQDFNYAGSYGIESSGAMH
jgi:hypothetical protein